MSDLVDRFEEASLEDTEPRVVELTDDEDNTKEGTSVTVEAQRTDPEVVEEHTDIAADGTSKASHDDGGGEDDNDDTGFYDFPKSLEQAMEAKEAGNNLYKEKEYDESLEFYSKAIAFCPETEECKATMATFYGNRAAAYFQLQDYECVVEDCTVALDLNTDYVKVLARRMQAFEKLEKYEDALNDAKKLQERDPSFPKIGETIMRLQRLYEEKMNKMKDEALGKLKDLGNSILGNFGMSLDNFNMKQDPATGSWSISMGK